MSTTAYLTLAAVVTIAIGAAHSYLGERMILGPLLAPGHRTGLLEKSPFAANALRFAWHLTTLTWWGIAALLLALARLPLDAGGRMTLAVVGCLLISHGIYILAVSSGRHLAWPAFLAAGALALMPLL